MIEQVQRAWGITIRDGFGQTESSLQIGNSPGQPIKLGSMGRPMPGFEIELVDPVTGELADEGEICVACSPERPVGLMVGYAGDDERNDEAFAGGRYHTGDVASRDADGYITYVGRTDDVFKASDYRISPFELESVLIEHPAVAEAAVVPSPDELRLAVPKAFVALVAGTTPSAELAADILRHAREHLAPYKRIRRLEFAELPKTISGKIRRVELREAEAERGGRARSAGGVPRRGLRSELSGGDAAAVVASLSVDQIGRAQLDLQAALAGRHEDGLVFERRAVDHDRQPATSGRAARCRRARSRSPAARPRGRPSRPACRRPPRPAP